jgi:hypothetical protein
MFSRIRALVLRRSGSNVFALFGPTILLPGVLLTVFGVRALVQERRFADQQIGERLDRVAQSAMRDLERDLHEWQAAVNRIDAIRVDGETVALPARLRRAFQEPGAGALVFREARIGACGRSRSSHIESARLRRPRKLRLWSGP